MAERERDITRVRFSFVAPVFNEAESLPAFYAQLREAADRLGEPYEIVLVNDGSTDDSLKVMRKLRDDDDRVKYVDLSRNFGQQEALTAGYDYAAGDAVITLDADCQHPPELIGELAARWRQGFEVVYTVRRNTADLPRWKRWASKSFYKVFTLLSGLDVADQADFRLLDRKVVDALKTARERARFLRGLVRWVGFRQTAVPYQARARQAGLTGYSFGKMARLAGAGVFNFSKVPLRAVGILGAGMMVVALLYFFVSLVLWPFLGTFGGSGFANLALFGVLLTGLQLAGLGILGEYVARTFDETKARPIYIVRDATGFSAEDEQALPAEAPRRGAVPPIEPSKIRFFT